MKIGLVLDDSLDKTDGVQQYVLTLGQWYRQQGHEVHYLVGQTRRKDIGRVHSLSRNLSVRFNQNRMSTPLPAKKGAIKSLLKRESFDVIHVQMPYSPFLAGRIIKLLGQNTALIGTFHVMPYSKAEQFASKLLGLVLWRNLRSFDTVVSVSEPARRFARKAFGIKSQVLPNTVAAGHFKTGKRIRKFDDGKVNIVFLGRLVPRKGCMQLLQALNDMHAENLLGGLRVIICGKGPQETSLKNFVKKHRLSKCVRFEGYVSEQDKPDYLATADIAIFPSLSGESFGIVLIEAMAARSGVVIGGNNPGYRTVLGASPTQLIDPNDQKGFVKTLKRFAFSLPTRKKALVWQTQQVGKYDVANVGNQLLQLYDQVIAKKEKQKHNVVNEPE